MKLQEVILTLRPDYKFETHIKFLKGEALEESLTQILLDIRKRMFLNGEWDMKKESLVKSVMKDINYYNAYCKVNNLAYPRNFSLFL